MKSNNNNIAFSILALVFSMLLLSFASVPIYNIFCKVTGYGGTVKREDNFSHHKKGSKVITVYFDANTEKKLPWMFKPKIRKTNVIVGENTIIYYEAQNLAKHDIIGTSIYNVTPQKAGKYFVKIHCFCFEEQLLKADQYALMPVAFYIDPDIENDPEMDGVEEITLSYSFFKIRDIDI